MWGSKDQGLGVGVHVLGVHALPCALHTDEVREERSKDQGLGVRVQGLGVWGSRFRVWGLGFSS